MLGDAAVTNACEKSAVPIILMVSNDEWHSTVNGNAKRFETYISDGKEDSLLRDGTTEQNPRGSGRKKHDDDDLTDLIW